MIKAGKNMTIDDMRTRILTTLQKERGPLPYVQLQEKARLQQENDFAKAMAELKYEDKISVDDKQWFPFVIWGYPCACIFFIKRVRVCQTRRRIRRYLCPRQ